MAFETMFIFAKMVFQLLFLGISALYLNKKNYDMTLWFFGLFLMICLMK